MRVTTVAAVVSLVFMGMASAGQALASIRRPTRIVPQELGTALQELAQERHFQIVYRDDVVGELRTPGASGDLTAAEALKQLLQGTGLSYRYLDENTVTVLPAAGAPASSSARSTQRMMSTDGSQDDTQNTGLWDRFRIAQMNQGSSASGGESVAPANADESVKLEEIVVTAQKKLERLQDVPVPVSVLSGSALAEQDKLSFADYSNTVPGFSFAPAGFGEYQLALRGVTTGGFTLPTVGWTIDGVPFGGLLDAPDIDPGDLARVEILRGPQGTLYGSSSMGGLVNFVTRDPSLDSFSGRIEAGTSSVQNGYGYGHKLRASANVPVNDTIALRVSGYTYTDPGYIDNPVRNLRGLNRTEAYGGRVALLVQPTDALSIKFSALYDHINHEGSSEVDVPTASYPQTAGLGDLQQNYISGVGGQLFDTKAYSLTVNAKLPGGISLTSLTGYNDVYDPATFDWTDTFGADAEKHFGVDGAANLGYSHYKKFTQELRLSGTSFGSLDWLLGGFYSHTKLPGYEVIAALDPSTGKVVGADWTIIYPRTYQEIAAFANFTYHFTDRFDVQIGGREARNQEHDATQTQLGPFLPTGYQTVPAAASKDNAFTYLVTPRFRISPNLMIYGRFASGFRPGGPNQNSHPDIPSSYKPDKTQNYEVGTKGDLLNGVLSFDASVYYIKWQDIQLQKFGEDNITFTTNGSAAKSEGVEVSTTVRPTSGLSISGWYSYNNAVLTQPLVNGPLYGAAGDRLPLSSRNSGNLSIQQEFAVGNAITGFVGTTEILVGDRVGVFTGSALRQDYPGYAMTDLRAGLKQDSWTGTLYINNVTNERGLSGGGLGYILPYAFIYTTPRTIGASVSKTF